MDEDFRKKLSPEAYKILREKGTEPPFCNAYWNYKEKGTYHCKGCGAPLFSSETKYDSGTGWPSFFKALDEHVIERVEDLSHGMRREEAICSHCKSHLGHIFPDGPPPTKLRFCMNSGALTFIGQDPSKT